MAAEQKSLSFVYPYSQPYRSFNQPIKCIWPYNLLTYGFDHDLPRQGCEVLRSSCLFVCLSARIFKKSYVQTSRNNLYVYLWPWLGSLLTTTQ